MILYLPVDKHDSAPARAVTLGLFEKTVPIDGTPAKGDMVQWWEDGPIGYVYQRYWDHAGVLNVELQRVTWLPSVLGDEWITSGVTSHSYYYPTSWRQDDEDAGLGLVAELEAGGWVAL